MVFEKVKSFDYFSSNYNLVFQGKEYFETKIGGIITLLTMIIFILFSFYLGQELIYKTKPNDTLTTQVSTTPPNLTFNIPIAFLIQYDNGSTYSDLQNLININTTYYDTYNKNGSFITNQSLNIKMRNCEHTDFDPELNYSYQIMTLDQAFCLDRQNQEIGGDFSGDFTKYIEIEITPCKNSSSNNFSCVSEIEQSQIFNSHQIEVALHHESLSYTSQQFSNPIQKILMEDDYIFDSKICKVFYYYIHKFNIVSENGFLFYNLEKKTYYEIEHVKYDFYMNQPGHDCLFKFYFQSSFYTRIQTRTYLTFSNVVAQVGGALNAYLLIFSSVFRFLYRKKMNEKIIRKLFSDHIDTHSDKTLHLDTLKNRNSIFEKKRFKSVVINSSPVSKLDVKKNDNMIYIHKLNPIRLNHHKNPDRTEYERNSNEIKLIKDSNSNDHFRSNLKLQSDRGIVKPEKIMQKNNSNGDFIIESQELQKKIEIIETGLKTQRDFPYLKKNSTINQAEEKLVSLLRFSIIDHFIFSFCSLCINNKRQRLKENFEELIVFSFRYLDIVNLVKKLHEFERLKFILFDKKQLALFNSISQPSNPLIDDENKMNAMAERLKFEHDVARQKQMIKSILENKEEFLNDKINIRLMKFYYNISN